MRPVHRVLQRVRVRSIAELVDVASLRPWWVFRGQASWKWRLTPHLERDRAREAWWETEQAELQSVRSAPRKPGDPEDDDHLAWLARLRHDGRPVRLLDFTRKLAVAVYFATREDTGDTPAIWAVDGYRLEIAWRNAVAPAGDMLYVNSPAGNCAEFNRIYDAGFRGRAAMFVEPSAANRRQELQQGRFLVGLDLTASLEESLFGCLGYTPAKVNPPIGPNGLPTGPVGFYRDAKSESVREKLKDSLLVQIVLEIEREDLSAYLSEEGVSATSLGL